MEGYAITTVKFEGVEHEFSTITGVMEDVTEIILNLKQVRFKRMIEDVDQEKVVVKLSGKDQFTAGDLKNVVSAVSRSSTLNKLSAAWNRMSNCRWN